MGLVMRRVAFRRKRVQKTASTRAIPERFYGSKLSAQFQRYIDGRHPNEAHP